MSLHISCKKYNFYYSIFLYYFTASPFFNLMLIISKKYFIFVKVFTLYNPINTPNDTSLQCYSLLFIVNDTNSKNIQIFSHLSINLQHIKYFYLNNKTIQKIVLSFLQLVSVLKYLELKLNNNLIKFSNLFTFTVLY